MITMLMHLALLLSPPADAIQRFHDFFARTKSFSVQIKASSENMLLPGKGTLILSKPGNVRLVMDWGAFNYTLIKNGTAAVEYQRHEKLYQEYPSQPSFSVPESEVASLQGVSLPRPMFEGDLRRYASAPYRLTASSAGVDTLSSNWGASPMMGRTTVKIAKDGRLLHLDLFRQTPNGTIHRIYDFSGYVINPKTPSNVFAAVPPLGYTCYSMPTFDYYIEVGKPFHLGRWHGQATTIDLDRVVRGKLLVVRSDDSPPADALIAYLKSKASTVPLVVATLGTGGAAYHSPEKGVAQKLGANGTPLMILFNDKGLVSAMWLGFDSENASKLVKEIAAAKENDKS